jgi:2'-5' RNA ligase
MQPPDREGHTLGQFALVSYIPVPLARFLDDLRLELAPGCKPHAHVTVLPPRPLFHDLKETVELIAEETRAIPPFEVELGTVEIFELTQVVYIELARGADRLRELYGILNCDQLEHDETFPYHPHITLAQNTPSGEAEKLAAIARERWAAYKGPRSFLVDRLSFVQNVAPSIWTDVACLPLGAEVPVGR